MIYDSLQIKINPFCTCLEIYPKWNMKFAGHLLEFYISNWNNLWIKMGKRQEMRIKKKVFNSIWDQSVSNCTQFYKLLFHMKCEQIINSIKPVSPLYLVVSFTSVICWHSIVTGFTNTLEYTIEQLEIQRNPMQSSYVAKSKCTV